MVLAPCCGARVIRAKGKTVSPSRQLVARTETWLELWHLWETSQKLVCLLVLWVLPAAAQPYHRAGWVVQEEVAELHFECAGPAVPWDIGRWVCQTLLHSLQVLPWVSPAIFILPACRRPLPHSRDQRDCKCVSFSAAWYFILNRPLWSGVMELQGLRWDHSSAPQMLLWRK